MKIVDLKHKFFFLVITKMIEKEHCWIEQNLLINILSLRLQISKHRLSIEDKLANSEFVIKNIMTVHSS